MNDQLLNESRALARQLDKKLAWHKYFSGLDNPLTARVARVTARARRRRQRRLEAYWGTAE